MFTRAIVRPPGSNFAHGLTTVDLGAPDYARALVQHERYCAALEQCGLELVRLPIDLRFPDSTFVEDAAVVLANGAFLTRPGAPSRAGEVDAIAQTLATYYPQMDCIAAPGTLDGGDICEAGSHFLIGISARTNEDGARQLSTALARLGCTCDCIDVRGVPGILHLKSGIAYLGDNRMVVIDALAEHPALRRFELIQVPQVEMYAANCVRVNDVVLVAQGFFVFTQTLQQLGYNVIELSMSEYQKMDGGLSCLSLRF